MRRKAVSALDICKCDATLKGTSKEKLSAELTRIAFDASELIKKAYAAHAK